MRIAVHRAVQRLDALRACDSAPCVRTLALCAYDKAIPFGHSNLGTFHNDRQKYGDLEGGNEKDGRRDSARTGKTVRREDSTAQDMGTEVIMR